MHRKHIHCKDTTQIGNEIYLYEMLTMNLLQAMLVRRAEQSHRQSSNSAIRACYAHIHRSSIALRCSQTTRSHDQMIMWSNSERKLTSKWSAFTIHRLSIASRCSQTTQSSSSLLNSMVKQRTKVYVKVINFHNTSIARLARSARWSNSKFESSRWSDQLSQYTDRASHRDAYKQLKAHLACSTRWSNSERKLTSKWSTFTTHQSLV